MAPLMGRGALLAAAFALLCLGDVAPAQPLAATATAPTAAKVDPVYRGFGLWGGEIPFSAETEARQQKALDDALAALQPQRDGVHDVYVMTAGLWGDHVFEHEATEAGKILVSRYGAQGRAINLSNNFANAASTLPGATPGNLITTFNKIGQLMNPDEDLFVMFVTSHGGPASGIAIHDRERMEYLLKPSDLRSALDSSGIKNRVLILAACYSGQFIPAFNDSHTVILTAASSDRPSFGCAPENEWTYFGDAFFNQALRQGGGLVPAFQKAKKQILEWETRDGQAPSNPQLYVGADAAKILGAVEADAGRRTQ
jgi:hypothetical protein